MINLYVPYSLVPVKEYILVIEVTAPAIVLQRCESPNLFPLCLQILNYLTVCQSTGSVADPDPQGSAFKKSSWIRILEDKKLRKCTSSWGEVRWGEVRWGEVRCGEVRWVVVVYISAWLVFLQLDQPVPAGFEPRPGACHLRGRQIALWILYK